MKFSLLCSTPIAGGLFELDDVPGHIHRNPAAWVSVRDHVRVINVDDKAIGPSNLRRRQVVLQHGFEMQMRLVREEIVFTMEDQCQKVFFQWAIENAVNRLLNAI